MEKDKFTAIIVDDEQDAIDYLCDLLKSHLEINLLSQFTDPFEAIKEINNSKPDILFLDVQMPVITGFDIINEVRSDNYLPHIVFTTGYEKFAIRAIKYAALDYLLKPVNPFELESAIQKIVKHQKQNTKSNQFDRLFDNLQTSKPLKFNTSTGFIVIHPDEIIYLEASRNYCELFLTNNRKELVTCNMNQVHSMLTSNIFYRISRSHIINLSFLQKLERSKKKCYLEADSESIILPIPPGNIKELEHTFERKH
jgi:two-component system, LytTR family, response regulator